MKNFISLFIACTLVFSLCACGTAQNMENQTTTVNPTTEPQIQAMEHASKNIIDYPQIAEESLNSLIRQSVDSWITNEISEDVSLKLNHRVLRNDEICVSVLFEGTITGQNLAYPSKVIFPVTISKAGNSIVNSFRYILSNESFAAKFAQNLPAALQSEDYSQEQQDAITSYLYGTEEGYLPYLLTKADGAITENGLLVILEIPHAIGDYIKVEVPMKDNELEILFLLQNDTISYNDSTFTLCAVSDNYELYYGENESGYYFEINDDNGKLMDSGYYTSTTDISQVCDWIQLWYSVGMSNRMVKYYDTQQGRISQQYNNPLAVYEELVVYTDIVNDVHCFVVQNIFDSNVYYQTFSFDPEPASAFGFEAEFVDSTHIQVSYLIENDETYTTIIELG